MKMQILSDDARSACYKSLSVSTQQARNDVQTLALDAFAVGVDASNPHRTRDCSTSLRKLLTAIDKDMALSGKRFPDWIGAMTNLTIKYSPSEGYVIKTPKKGEGFSLKVKEEDITAWWTHNPEKSQQSKELGFDDLMKMFDRFTKPSDKVTVAPDVAEIAAKVRGEAEQMHRDQEIAAYLERNGMRVVAVEPSNGEEAPTQPDAENVAPAAVETAQETETSQSEDDDYEGFEGFELDDIAVNG